ncbi:OmpA family protein [Myxococcota bacterium]|jgi:outer membrane protein OmpA-like peptidoglycan-associated protein|nr:OmpA family protein [Myxococcota bacterium]
MKFQRSLTTLLAAALALGLAACGGPPVKTQAMNEYEAMRIDLYAQTVEERFPELAHEAKAAYRKAEEAHDDDEPELALHYTRIATFKWRTAAAKSRAQDAADATLSAENRVKIAEDELKDATRRKQSAHDALAQAQKIKALEGQMVRDEKAKRLGGVAAKVRDAVGMEAARHAPNELAKAEVSLKAAQDAFASGKLKDADKLTDTANVDADVLIAAVKPKYDAEKRERDLDARLRALLEKTDKGVVPGAKGKIIQRGFVLTLRGTFAPAKAEIAADQTFSVDRVADLAKEFSEFKLAIEGHTDNQGRKDANLTTSQNRAQAVLSYLAAKGVDVSRMSALGKGDTEPVADNRTKAGREQNRRVDVVFLRP